MKSIAAQRRRVREGEGGPRFTGRAGSGRGRVRLAQASYRRSLEQAAIEGERPGSGLRQDIPALLRRRHRVEGLVDTLVGDIPPALGLGTQSKSARHPGGKGIV